MSCTLVLAGEAGGDLADTLADGLGVEPGGGLVGERGNESESKLSGNELGAGGASAAAMQENLISSEKPRAFNSKICIDATAVC